MTPVPRGSPTTDGGGFTLIADLELEPGEALRKTSGSFRVAQAATVAGDRVPGAAAFGPQSPR